MRCVVFRYDIRARCVNARRGTDLPTASSATATSILTPPAAALSLSAALSSALTTHAMKYRLARFLQIDVVLSRTVPFFDLKDLCAVLSVLPALSVPKNEWVRRLKAQHKLDERKPAKYVGGKWVSIAEADYSLAPPVLKQTLIERSMCCKLVQFDQFIPINPKESPAFGL